MRPGTGKDTFGDVAEEDWYYDVLSIASEYRLIFGYGSGKFGPMDKITREQAMTIIARAMKITGLKVELTDSEVNKALTSFTDANLIGPKDNITRAEVAAIVRRLIQKSGLI